MRRSRSAPGRAAGALIILALAVAAVGAGDDAPAAPQPPDLARGDDTAHVRTTDHFVVRGARTTPVLEAWTALAVVGGTTRRLGLMTFVANVMNRHPAVLARMAATLQEATGGRLTLGIGIGGHPAEHAAYGIPFPPARERVARLEEAVAVMRALWTGGPVTRHHLDHIPVMAGRPLA